MKKLITEFSHSDLNEGLYMKNTALQGTKIVALIFKNLFKTFVKVIAFSVPLLPVKACSSALLNVKCI